MAIDAEKLNQELFEQLGNYRLNVSEQPAHSYARFRDWLQLLIARERLEAEIEGKDWCVWYCEREKVATFHEGVENNAQGWAEKFVELAVDWQGKLTILPAGQRPKGRKR